MVRRSGCSRRGGSSGNRRHSEPAPQNIIPLVSASPSSDHGKPFPHNSLQTTRFKFHSRLTKPILSASITVIFVEEEDRPSVSVHTSTSQSQGDSVLQGEDVGIVFDCGELVNCALRVVSLLSSSLQKIILRTFRLRLIRRTLTQMAISAWQLLQVAAVQVLGTMLMIRGWAFLAAWRRMLETLWQMHDASGTSDVAVSLLALLSCVVSFWLLSMRFVSSLGSACLSDLMLAW